MLEVILLWFCPTSLSDWFRKLPLSSQPITFQTLTPWFSVLRTCIEVRSFVKPYLLFKVFTLLSKLARDNCRGNLLYSISTIKNIYNFSLSTVSCKKNCHFSNYAIVPREIWQWTNLFKFVCILYIIFGSFNLILHIWFLGGSERAHEVL